MLGIQLPDQDEEDPDFGVDPDNWDAVTVFYRCTTQWRHGPMGGVFGLDYPGVQIVLDRTQPKKKHNGIFTALQLMEQAAMAVMNSKSK